MKTDDLVYVSAAGCYASVFEQTDEGLCEVGLIDPRADDYSLTVPASTLVAVEDAGLEDMDRVARELVLLHLRINHGFEFDRSLHLYVGRREDADLDVMMSIGPKTPVLIARWGEVERVALEGALSSFDLPAWRDGGGLAPALDGWGWSMQVIGAGMGCSGFGHNGWPASLERLIATLGTLGIPVCWCDGDGPHASCSWDELVERRIGDQGDSASGSEDPQLPQGFDLSVFKEQL